MTDIDQTLGTAEYISPERTMDSHRVDIRADIYSLGCTLFRLLTGQPPYAGRSTARRQRRCLPTSKSRRHRSGKPAERFSESLAAIVRG